MIDNDSYIVFFHRIKEDDKHELPYIKTMEVSPTLLETFIKSRKKNGYTFVSLDTLTHAIRNKVSYSKWIAITLDDGYIDNFEIAYPIFKKYKVPFCIYITTTFIERSGLLWWHIIHEIAQTHIQVHYEEKIHALQTSDEKNAFCFYMYKTITQLGTKKEAVEQLILSDLKEYIRDIDIDKFYSYFLSWEQIKILNQDPLCTIGAHCIDHYVLDILNKDEIIYQTRESKKIIEQHLGSEVRHFAYPNGNFNLLTYDTIKALDIFDTVVTCKQEYLDKYSDPHLLPRIYVDNNTPVNLDFLPRCFNAEIPITPQKKLSRIIYILKLMLSPKLFIRKLCRRVLPPLFFNALKKMLGK